MKTLPNLLVNLTQENAEQILHLVEWPFRIARKDQETFTVTDFNLQRINLEIDNNFVTKVWRG